MSKQKFKSLYNFAFTDLVWLELESNKGSKYGRQCPEPNPWTAEDTSQWPVRNWAIQQEVSSRGPAKLHLYLPSTPV